MFPNRIFRIKDPELIEKLKVLKTKQANIGIAGVISGGMAVIIANLLRPLTDYFDIHSSTFANLIIVLVAVIFMFSLRFYVNYSNRRSLYKVINLEQLETERIWIRPETTKHFFLVLGNYLIFLAFSVLGFMVFIEFPNVMILFFSMLILFFVSFTNFMTVKEGNTTVKFKRD